MIRPSNFRSESAPPPSPFFGLLAEADEIQIREVHFEDRDQVTETIEKAQSDLRKDAPNKQSRSFIVHIRNDRRAELTAANESGNYDTRQLKRSAELLLESGDYILARNLFSYVTRQDTRDLSALRGLGICLLRLGEISSAKKCFRSIHDEINSDESATWVGLCYAHESNDLAALDCFSKIKDAETLENRLRFDFYKSWGNSLTRLGRLKEAEAKYQAAQNIDPNSDILQVNFGTLYLQDLQHRSARESFSRALALNPRNSRAHCGLGLVAVSEGEREEAEKHFVASLDLDSQNQVALLQLFSLLQQRGDYSVVTPYLQQHLIRDPHNADVHYALAEAYFSAGAWRDCESHIEACLKTQPNYAQALKLSEELKTVSVPR